MSISLVLSAIRSGDTDDQWLHSAGRRTSPTSSAREIDTEGPDQQIAARIRASDEAAFRELYSAQYGSLCDFVMGYVRDTALAEDVVGELFLYIWRTREQFHITGTVRAYLFGAARYRAFSILRDRKRSAEREAVSIRLLDDGEDSSLQTERAIEETVWAAIDALPERSRLVMTLRWKEEMSLDEVARVLGVSEMAVRQLHKRALAALRKHLPDLLE